MNLGERAAARRKSKELKSEIKELKKKLIAAGCDKAEAGIWLRDFQETLELGAVLRDSYVEAAKHLVRAQLAIGRLLDDMGEVSASAVAGRLKRVVTELAQVYHDCLVQENDLDFGSTFRNLKQMAEGDAAHTVGMQAIMLRSELENVSAVLKDAAEWTAPDFFALAYYFLHGDKAMFGEMENELRNAEVLAYTEERFSDAFLGECKRAGVEKQAQELIARETGYEQNNMPGW